MGKPIDDTIIVVLGAPNLPSGELSGIARSRLDLCFEQYHKEKNCRILCTGGWGGQFNTSEKPHAFHAMNYLLARGMAKDRFLEFALSSNTVDDAVKAAEVLQNIEYHKLVIVTSDYHLQRARLIFDEILPFPNKEYWGASTPLNSEELERLMAHEKKSVDNILNNGLYY